MTSTSPPPAKRQKVAIACNPCRSRKVKCDGREPVCNRCQERPNGASRCTWNFGQISTEHLNHIRSLEARIRQLEEDPVVGKATDDSSHSHSTSLTAQEPSPCDRAVSAVIGAITSDRDNEDVYGSASAGTFLQRIKTLVRNDLPAPGQPGFPSSQNTSHHGQSPSSIVKARHPPLDYVLPSRRTADSLIAAYFDDYVNPLYPWLDEDQIRDDYDKLWSGGTCSIDERSFLCILNAIFAISTQLSGSAVADERFKAADVFYRRSHAFLNILDPPSLQAVQSYLLLGLYFQSTNDPHSCWVFVGLAIRAAQSLGLHLPHTSHRVVQQNSREMLRRVWHGCVLMDRVLAMTYGRPCMIGPATARSVPLPLPISSQAQFSTNTQDGNESPRIVIDDFYVSQLRLYEILHDILFTFYRVDDAGQLLEDLYDHCFGGSSLTVFQIDRRLSRWDEALPDHLRIPQKGPSSASRSKHDRPAIILRQRLLHIRLLLLRPALSYIVSGKSPSDSQFSRQQLTDSSSLVHRSFLQCAIVCVCAAQETIDLVRTYKPPRVGEVGELDAWWYNVLFLYTSTTVLIAARLSSAILSEVSEDSLLASWRSAIGTLQEYAAFNTSINFLIATLKLLFDAVPQQYSRFESRVNPAATDVASIMQTSNAAAMSSSAAEQTTMTGTFVAANSQEDNAAGNLWPDSFESADLFGDLGFTFDPTDLSWLTTIPTNT